MALAAGLLAKGSSRAGCPSRPLLECADSLARLRCEAACAERCSLAQSVIPAPRTSSQQLVRRRDSCTALHALALGQAQLEDEAAAILNRQEHRLVFGLWHKVSGALDATRRVVALAVRIAQFMILAASVRLRRQQLELQRVSSALQAEAPQRSKQQPRTVPERSELRQRVKTLYELSAQSSCDLQQALRHGERSLEDTTGRVFFKSPLTKAVMEQESALKSLVFAQVLAANSKRQAM
ncbi:hypothetical protein WJX73_000546 [Symbiochloris irregularis]|uniref:Uncharacterized protein n=1 Tax=Symbiochloris irregularis TaxID=706552 RepID=A0AAW1P0L0_9CHLO